MATAGPNYTTTWASTSSTPYDDEGWVNVGNLGSASTLATITAATYDSPDYSYLAIGTAFGFSIPSGATIDGVTVEINGRYDAGTASIAYVALHNAGSVIGTAKTTDPSITSSLATYTFGGTSDNWGATLTDSVINSSTFGVRFSVQADSNNTDISFDWARITVTYTPVPIELTLAAESTSSVAVIGSQYNCHEVALALESKSAVTIVPSEVVNQWIDLEIPIDMLDHPVSTTINTQQDWLRSDEWLNPSNYDGDLSYIFEVVTIGVSATDLISLIDVDASNQVVATVSTYTTALHRVRVVFTPNSGDHCYRLRTNSNATNYKVWAARIIIQQTGGSKTRIPIAQLSPDGYNQSYTGNSGTSGTLASTTSSSSTDIYCANYWKYVESDWSTLGDVTVEALSSMSTSTTGYVYLTDTSNNVASTLTVTANASMTRYTATGVSLTDNTTYKFRYRTTGTGTIYLFKARIYLTLNPVSKAEVYWRQNGAWNGGSADLNNDQFRFEIDKTRYSGTSNIYYESTGWNPPDNPSGAFGLADYQYGGTAGTPTLVTGSGINPNTSTTTLFRTSNIASNILSGNDYGVYIDWTSDFIYWFGGALVVTAQAVYPPTYTYPTYIGVSGSQKYASNSDPSVCTVPAGVEANDVLLLFCMSQDLTNQTVTFQPQDPASITWNAIGSVERASAANHNAYQAFWRRVASSSEAGTTISTYHTNESATCTFGEVCVAYRYCPTSGDPFDEAVYVTESTAVTSHDIGAVTVSGTHRTLVILHGHEDNTMFSTGPSGYVQRYADVTPFGGDFSLAVYDKADQSSDGATTLTIATTEIGSSLHIALKPSILTHEITLGLESTSAVTVVGSKATVDKEITLALESTTSVAVVGSQTHATHEVTLAKESASSVVIGKVEGPRGTKIEDFTSTSGWTASGAGVTLDTDSTHTREGHAQQVRLNIPSGVTGTMTKTLGATVDMSAVESVELWFYVDATYTGSSYFNTSQIVRFGTDASNYYQRTNHGGNTHPGWNVARWSPTASFTNQPQWSTTGSPNWNAIDYLYFGMTTTQATNITYCSLRINAKGARAAFLMTFDDGNESVYDVARSILNSRGMHGTPYVTTNSIGTAGKMTSAELQTLASDGWYIGNHTADHTDLTTLTYAQVQSAVTEGRQDIQAISGLESHGKHGAYPYGWNNSTVNSAIADLGTDLTWREVGGTNSSLDEAVAAPLHLSSQSDLEDNAIGSWQEVIDLAALTGEAVVALVHTPGTSMTTQTFTDLCEYAAVTKGLWCPNIDEWYQYASNAGVGKIDATWEITLGLESTSAVTAAPAKTGTHQVALALESTSSVAVVGSKTDATWEVSLAAESTSAVTAVGSQTHAAYEVTLSLQSLSSVAVAPLVNHAILEVILALEATTSAVVVPSQTQAIREVTLAVESTSSVVVAGSITHAAHEVSLALQSTTSVAAVGSLVHATFEAALALESTTSVAAVGTKTEAIWEVTLAAQSTSAVTVAALAMREVVLAKESTTSVVVAAAKTGTQEITLALESATAVTVAASQTQAVYEVSLALQSTSAVAVGQPITSGLLAEWSAIHGNAAGDGPGSGTTWYDLKNAYDITFGSASQDWVGDGTDGNPYAVRAIGGNPMGNASLYHAGHPTSFTYDLWIFLEDAGINNQFIIDSYDTERPEGGHFFFRYIGVNQLQIVLQRSVTYSGSYVLSWNPYFTEGWHHFVFSYDVATTTFRVVIDGAQYNSTSTVTNWDVVGQHFNLLANPALGTKFAALRLYNRALALDEAQYHYSLGPSADSVQGSLLVNHVEHEVVLAKESTSAVTAAGSKTEATWEIALALESTSSVTAIGTKVEAAWDIALALQSTTSVAAAGSKTDATWEVALAAESTTAVAVVGAASGTSEVQLALESTTSVTVVASQTQAIREVTLALESTSAVTVAASQVQAIREVTLALEAASAVTVLGSKTDATWEISLAKESTSAVTAVGTKVEATWEVALLSESTSAVTVWAGKTDATWEVALSAESTSAVAVAGAKSGTSSISLALESTTSVTVVASQTQAIYEVALAAESTSAVTVAGSIVHRTVEITLALQSTSSVAAIGQKTEAIWEVSLARESTSVVTVVGVRIIELRLALESRTAIDAQPGATGTSEVALALESTTGVAVVPSSTHATWELVLARESSSAVTAVGSITHAAHEILLARESTTLVTAEPTWVPLDKVITLALESRTGVTVTPSKIGNDLDITHGAPESGWRASIISRDGGWTVGVPESGWATRSPVR